MLLPVLAVAAAAAVSSAPLDTYAALGDSTCVGMGARHGGYPPRLADRAARAGERVRLVNLCASGARVADVLRRQLEGAVDSGPAIVTVGVGINDALVGTDAGAYARDLEQVARRLEASGAGVVLLTVPDLALSPLAVGPEAQASLRGRVRIVNAAIADVARRHGFALVDLFAAGPSVYGGPATLSGDRFHPSDLGYERWSDLAQGAFERLLAQGAARRGAGLAQGAGVR